MVEHATENRSVGGSIPPLGTAPLKHLAAGPTGASADSDRLTLYHDGACPLCRREVAHYQRQDGAGRLAFVDVADARAILAPGLDRSAAMSRFHVRLPDGRLVSGAAGFVAVWRQLPGWRWLARGADLPGVLPVLEVGYRLSLLVRPRLSRLVGRLARD